DDADGMFADLKKKKKKSKSDFNDTEAAEPVAANEEDLDLESLKKKKKKKKKNMAEFEAELAEDGGDDAEPGKQGDEKEGDEAWLKSDRDYQYEELLSRVFKILKQNNPELAGEKKRYTIVPPQIARDGNKKTVFANVADICRRLHRQPEHVIQFLFAELGTTGSVDGSQRLILKGRWQQKQIENVLRRYIVEYVTCKTCKSPDTILSKDNRLYFVQCEACGSHRSVSAIKTGFKATSKEDRRALRA
ncbi:domain found in IF2B/IF5-domain-containing protein, partial [Dichotomocladium elegans]